MKLCCLIVHVVGSITASVLMKTCVMVYILKFYFYSCFFSLLENAGLSERQEGCGLFSKSGWSDAVMQVTLPSLKRERSI